MQEFYHKKSGTEQKLEMSLRSFGFNLGMDGDEGDLKSKLN
jgi:hypothetical protein